MLTVLVLLACCLVVPARGQPPVAKVPPRKLTAKVTEKIEESRNEDALGRQEFERNEALREKRRQSRVSWREHTRAAERHKEGQTGRPGLLPEDGKVKAEHPFERAQQTQSAFKERHVEPLNADSPVSLVGLARYMTMMMLRASLQLRGAISFSNHCPVGMFILR